MSMFDILEGGNDKERREDIKFIRLNTYADLGMEYEEQVRDIEKGKKPFNKTVYMRFVFYYVKQIKSLQMAVEEPDFFSDDFETGTLVMKTMHSMIKTLQIAVQRLTLRDILSFFPIGKDYNGERWQCKDYYTAMELVNNIGIDTLLSERPDVNIISLFSDLNNPHLMNFVVTYLCIVDTARRKMGKVSLIEEFTGAKPMVLRKDEKGKEYMVDTKTNKSYKVSKKRPNYLKIVK